MMIVPTHSTASLSGTLAKRTKLTLKPNFAKEPFSPSLPRADTKQHCAKIESFELITTKSRAYNKVHIAGRGSAVRQLRILVSQFRPFGQERSPKSAPTTFTIR
jgi:hypothetical protein